MQKPTTSEGVAWAVFERLVDEDIKDPRARERMNHEQRLLLAINLLRQEVASGGFDSYFWHGYRDPLAAEAARLLGPAWHELVGKAFAADENEFDELDERLYALEVDHPADEVLDRFVWAHQEAFFGAQA